MYHYNQFSCYCTVFRNKALTLTMLSIHSILIQCEEYFSKYQNFDGISDFYNMKFLNNFDFYVYVEFNHASLYKSKRFIAECSIFEFFDHLKHTFNLNKMIDVSIIMMCREEFESYVEMNTTGIHNFELADCLISVSELEVKVKNRNKKIKFC